MTGLLFQQSCTLPPVRIPQLQSTRRKGRHSLVLSPHKDAIFQYPFLAFCSTRGLIHTGTHPGDTFDLDYSVARTFAFTNGHTQLQIGMVGYEQRQTTAKTGSAISPTQSKERYVVNAIGFVSGVTFPRRKINAGAKFFEEFANRATFQGFSLQVSGGVSF